MSTAGLIAAQTPARNNMTVTRNSALFEKAIAERDDHILDQQHNIKFLQNQSKPYFRAR